MWAINVCIRKQSVLDLFGICCFLSYSSEVTTAVRQFSESLVFLDSEMYRRYCRWYRIFKPLSLTSKTW
jgi:hypothetical protein